MQPTIGKRVIVIGSSNAGKSTLAERLAERLGVPFIELDGLYWEPGWVEAEREVFRERVRRAIEPEAWVMAGNYTRHQLDISWPVADTIVWLDLPLPTVLRRCVARCWGRWRSQEALWGGSNRENFWKHLMFWNTKESLPAYQIRHHRARRRMYEALLRDPRWSHISFIRLRSPEEVDRWLAGVAPTPLPATSAAGQPAAGR